MSRQEKSWDKLLRYASFATLFSMCNGQADEINLQYEMKNASFGFSELNSSCNGISLFIVCSKLILEGKIIHCWSCPRENRENQFLVNLISTKIKKKTSTYWESTKCILRVNVIIDACR